jgi:hypothetical protein
MIGNYNWFLAILSLHYHQKHRLSSPEKKIDHPRKKPWSIIPEKKPVYIPGKRTAYQ